MDGGLLQPAARSSTYLQRAFDAFHSAAPLPLSVRGLAAMLRCEVASAYNYIARMKRMKVIKLDPATTSARCPSYLLVDGARRPPDDSRGRKPSRPPTATSRWKP